MCACRSGAESVAQTQAQLDAWRATPLAVLDLAVLLLDGPRGTPLGLMRIPGSTDRHAVLLQHRLEDFQARRDDQRLQFGLRVDQDIDQRQVPKRRRR